MNIIHLLLYSNRSESGTLLTKKNILPVTRVLANKAKGGVPEGSANFMLSNFDLVPAVEVNHFLGTQGVSFRNGQIEKRLGFEEINVHWMGIVLRVKHWLDFDRRNAFQYSPNTLISPRNEVECK